MSDIMLDLETLGKKPGCVILSVGAVKFDIGGVRQGFYARIDLKSSMESGLTVDPSTLKWWMGQGEAARKEVVSAGGSVRDVLTCFTHWVGDPVKAKIWGNGAAFDNAILSSAYQWLGIEPPWKFWNDRCYRTIKECVPDIKIQRQGTHHNALHDAESQAEHLIEIAKNVVWVNEAFSDAAHPALRDEGPVPTNEN